MTPPTMGQTGTDCGPLVGNSDPTRMMEEVVLTYIHANSWVDHLAEAHRACLGCIEPADEREQDHVLTSRSMGVDHSTRVT